MGLILKLSAGLLLGSLLAFGDIVTLVGASAGSAFGAPGPSVSRSFTLPASTTYVYSQSAGLQTYSASATASGSMTTAAIQIATSLAPGLSASNFGQSYVDSFSGAFLQIQGPVFLEESVSVSYSLLRSPAPGQAISVNTFGGWSTELDFLDVNGNPIGNCSLGFANSPVAPTTTTCSTGKVLVGGDSAVTVSNSMQALFSAGGVNVDLYNFNATATLGPLEVFDLNGNLIESIDLSSLTAVPEPSGVGLMVAGILGLIAARGRKA